VNSDTIDPEHLLTSSEVGVLLQVNASSVKKWVNAGFLSAFRTPGGHRRIRAADLIDFLGRHRMPVPHALRGAARRRVVIVDDDRLQLRALERRLKRYSDVVAVEVIDDPLDALVTIGAAPAHAVVVDVVMPHASGLELCRALRKHDATRDALLIAVSAHMTPVLADEARRAGANHAVGKPIDLQFLLNELGLAAESRR
jgi:excisionase family DNA binding protein